jgi:hypothetical protein
MIVGVLWLEGYVRDQFVSALQITGQVDRGRRGLTDDQVDSLVKDTLLGFRVIGDPSCAAGPRLRYRRDETRRCRLETPYVPLLYCRRMVSFLRETSGLVIALVAWLLAWACALAMPMSFNRRRA